MAHIYTLSISPIWNDDDSILLSFVSPIRQKKILSYVNDADKKLSLYAALLVRMQMSSYSNISVEQLYFVNTMYNQPILVNAPNCFFSISHTRNKILVAVSLEPIGVDVEILTSPPLDVMDTVFHPAEICYVKNTGWENEEKRRFFKIWTRKEALTKQIGVGLSEDAVSYNTLSVEYDLNFISWVEKEYMYTIYKTNPRIISYTELDEKDIFFFFIRLTNNTLKGSVL